MKTLRDQKDKRPQARCVRPSSSVQKEKGRLRTITLRQKLLERAQWKIDQAAKENVDGGMDV